MGFLKKLFSGPQENKKADPASAVAGLRKMILETRPDQLKIYPSEATPTVWGVLMEIGMAGAVVTVVSLADGTTSMYFSSGGGMIGAGEHPGPAAASRQLVQTGERLQSAIPESMDCPSPQQGHVRFHLLTFNGRRSIEVEERQVREAAHSLFPLYAHGQDVITAVRLKTEHHQA